jgi:autotransporter-associated beta strand protein
MLHEENKMNLSAVLPVCRFVIRLTVLAAFALIVPQASGDPAVLRWNGPAAGTNLWDATSLTWLDAGANAVVWQPGSEARFEGAGGLVNVAADVAVSNITFASNGYTLLGAGRLAVEGTLASAAATTNSLGVEIVTAAGLAKTGGGALALARCAGAVAAQEGALLVSGSLFADADLSVSSGASVVTLGDPDAASNLILNPGFELPAMGNGSWSYVSAGNVISNWTVTALPMHIGRQNTASAGSPWNSAGASPEGAHMLIMQYNGAVSQTVTVPADGLYSIAFSHLLRSGYPDHQVYVTLDGIPLASFLNRSVQFSPGRYASAALWLTAGTHTLGIGGEGGWNDRATMVDAVCFAAPSAANACRAFTGDSVLKAFTGASVQLSHTGTVPLAYVALDGTAASGTFNSSHASGIFTGGGGLSCTVPGNVYAWGGTGLWSETARWADATAPTIGGSADFVLRFPSAAGNTSSNDLGGTFLARRLLISGLVSGETFALAGNPVALTNDASGTGPKLSLPTPGTVTVATPVTASSALTLESRGDLTFTGNTLTLTNGSTFYKFGSGTVTFPTLTNTVANAFVYEGFLQTPSLPSSVAISLLTQAGKTSGLVLTQAGTTLANTLNLLGSGAAWISTRAGGGTVTLSSPTLGHGDIAVFDVGSGDTLSLRNLQLVSSSKGLSVTSLTKTGPGTLEIRAAGTDNANNRAYQGNTTLRNGTLRLSEDDFGTLNGWTNPFNGRTYGGTGGSLGYSAFTNAVRLGDSGTAVSDSLALIANGHLRYVGHNFEVMNVGAGTTIGMTTGSVLYAGDILLHKTVTLAGQSDGRLTLNGNLTAASDFAGTSLVNFSGLSEINFNGTLSASLSLASGSRTLRFGDKVVKTTTLASLALGGTTGAPAMLDVDFGPAQNDRIVVTATDGLTLSPTRVNLRYATFGTAFAEPGIYTLITYAGSLNGTVADLSVTNAAAGITYAFSNDTANTRILLTLTAIGGGASAGWSNPGSGAWSVSGNWFGGVMPDAADTAVLFGSAIPSAATVTLDGPRTAGDLDFRNPFSYTLTGSALTLSKTAGTSTLHVYQGNQTLNMEINSASAVSVVAEPGTSLTLSSNAVAKSALSFDAGTLNLRGASVEGLFSQGASTVLSVAGTNSLLGGLAGGGSASLILSGTSPKLTVSGSGNNTYAGSLSAAVDARLEKTGAGILNLTGSSGFFSGTLASSQGTLALQGIPFAGALAVAAPGNVSILSVTNGLMGFYYNVTPNTNNFFTLAAMETHFATLKPDLMIPSSQAGTNFDFGATGALFPQPYCTGGSRTTDFEAVWRGSITVPLADYYTFRVSGDDGYLLAIDGKQVLSRNYYAASASEGVAFLEAGSHDVVLGYFQITGGYGLQVQFRSLYGTFAPLSSAWLKPATSVGALSGNGALSLSTSNTQFTVAQNTSSAFSGELSGPAGSLFTKSGVGTLTLNSVSVNSNAFAGDVAVQSGLLVLETGERINDNSLVTVANNAMLKLNAAETVGGLSGAGIVTLGGSVYVTAFSGDADSGISSSKTYTHLLDFPSGTANAVVNGVTFSSSGMNGTRNGYSWNTTGTLPGGVWNDNPNDATRTGIDNLLWDFYYNSTDYTFTLSGLTPSKVYETRFYFRNFGNSPRDLTFTFTAGSTPVGTIAHNPDTGTRSMVVCRYAADTAGTLSVRIISLSGSHTCHLYGMSNEEVPSVGAAALTLNAPAGRTARYTGALTGSGTLVKQGSGTQVFSGTNSIASPVDVQAGTLSFEPGASVLSGAVVSASATVAAPNGNVWLGGLKGAGTFRLDGITPYPTNRLYTVTFTNDAGTEISTSKVYTHKLDFGTRSSPATVINGVSFTKSAAQNGAVNGFGWVNFPPSSHGGNAPPTVPLGSGIYNLLYDMDYGYQYPGSVTMQLNGLTPGKRYEVRFYNRIWQASDRTQTLTFDPDGAGPAGSESVTFNPDAAGSLPNFVAYRYTAGATNLAITLASKFSNQTYHLYGLSNEEVSDAAYVPVTVDITKDSVLDGAVTGAGSWTKTGAASFTVTGNSTATGPVAVNAGAFGVANGGVATRGPVTVAPGARLFGNGTVGGAVIVASNAWIQAGTASACGTLWTDASLALAPGARIAWRYDTAASDSFVVNGLTFPTNGTVQASTLTFGARAPGNATLFTSTQAINGPADLTGWTVVGVTNASLVYSADRTKIFFRSPHGTLIRIL